MPRWETFLGGPVRPSRPGAPPAEWQEHWTGHDQLLFLADASDSAAVYVDRDVPRAAGRRMLPYVEEVWQYATGTYGSFGPEPRLYAVIHGDRHRDSHRATYFDPSHEHRNVVDCGAGQWRSADATVLDLINLQVGRIVETANHGAAASPALGIWGDGRWAEIFRYDFHVALGRGAHAAWLADRPRAGSGGQPPPGSDWFRRWFHPLWMDSGGTRVLVRFFDLLAEHFPRTSDGSFRRMLTWGEFLHFSSGAAGGDVSALARRAFGWRPGWDGQLDRARTDFPLGAQ